LLSPGAEANTKPELEIYADDVKANHGATVGRLDEEKMFYLQSRGLNAVTAESLLSEAFAADIYMKIPVPGARSLVEAAHGL
jgi:Fe-S cluster assembly protein SufD